VEPRLLRWRASDQPRAVALTNAYSVYLRSGVANHGFRLVPSDSLLLFTFSSGQAPGRDYQLSRLEGVRYVIVGADTLLAATNPTRGRFYREVADRFRIVHEERAREREDSVQDQPGTVHGRILVLERKKATGP